MKMNKKITIPIEKRWDDSIPTITRKEFNKHIKAVEITPKIISFENKDTTKLVESIINDMTVIYSDYKWEDVDEFYYNICKNLQLKYLNN